jgi:hypothetical protein
MTNMNTTRREAEQNSALEAIRDLQASHFSEDAEAADENGKFTITFRVTFDRRASPTVVQVSSRIATHEHEIKNPEQPTQPAKAKLPREEAPQPTQWLTERELAAQLRLSVRHLINLRKAGLPFVQLGASVRYDLAEVDAYLRGNRRLSSHIERKRRSAAIQVPPIQVRVARR